MRSFIYETLPSRVIFGAGKLAELKSETEALGQKALILSTASQVSLAEQAAELLHDSAVGVHAEAVMHVPQEKVDDAVKVVDKLGAKVLVAIGGGSTIGLAKGMALETGLPILAVPTTYAGSEMTHIWGISKDGHKTTGKRSLVKPKTVIYDPTLTKHLPPAISATSGMNAVAHSVEALYAEHRNPVVSLMAEESIKALASSLPQILKEPFSVSARSEALYGAWLAGTVLGMVGMALHHKLCHVLGGTFNLPHAETHTVILPHATAYNASHAPDAMNRIAQALGTTQNAAAALYDLERSLNTPLSLKELGMTESQLDEAADIAVQNPYYNPRPVTRKSVREVLQNAFEGRRPKGVVSG